MRARPRQIALLTSLAGGFALLGASAHGIVGLDDRLQTATRPAPEIRVIDVADRDDCPRDRRVRAAPEI